MKTLSSPRRMKSVPLGPPILYKEGRGTSARPFPLTPGSNGCQETIPRDMPFSWFMELFVHTVFLDVSHAILWVKGVAMPSPFPGMDPYLETPDRWRNVHGNLATEI